MDNIVANRTLRTGEMLNWYRIERVLGRGGFGVIYLATDTNLDHRVAIKEYRLLGETGGSDFSAITENLREKANVGLQRFIDEARNLVRFKHPNIVRVMSVFELNDTAYMVMEFEEGHDLFQHLSIAGNRAESALKSLLVPITEGLAQVHDSGFIHRDIKPANIMVRTDGSPVLLDFGSARSATPLTADSLTALVSAGYSPLEQYSGNSEEQQGPWTDIYALGAVLYFAVTGVEPVDSAQRGSAIVNGGQDPLIRASMLGQDRYSESFLRAIDWALEFRIANRPQSLAQWRPSLLAPVHAAQDPGSVTSPEQTIRVRETRRVYQDETVFAPQVFGDTGAQASRASTGTPISRSTQGFDPLDGLSMRAQPAPREVEAVRARRFGRRSMGWLIWSSAGVLLLGAGIWLMQDQTSVELARTPTNSSSEPVLTEQERQNAAAAAEQAERERKQALVAQRQAQQQAEARAAAIRAAELANARKQTEAQQLGQEQSAGDTSRDTSAEAAGEVANEASNDIASDTANETVRDEAIEEARQTAITAADKAAAEETAAKAARAAELKAEQERTAAREVQAREAREAARARARQLERELDRATTQLQQGLLSEAKQSLDNAAGLTRDDARLSSLRTRLQNAVQDANTPVSDADFDYVIERFDALRRAVESGDVETMQALTIASNQNALFQQLMSRFATLDIRIDRIRVRNIDKSISATLRIETMIRDNGDRATPSSAYRERTISSRRVEGQWTLIQW